MKTRISTISANAKKLQKSLGAIRSFMLEYSKELELTEFEIKTLKFTIGKNERNVDAYKNLKDSVQFTKNNTTCVYWVIRTLAKMERAKQK